MTQIAHAARRVLVRHRHLAPVLGSRPTLGPNALAALELTIGQLRAAGFGDLQAALGANAIDNWASGFADFECRDPMGPAATEAEREAYVEAVAATFAALPPDVYPNTTAMLPVMSSITADTQFESGLQWLLDGLAVELARPSGEAG
jgi:hypothetical protein